MDIKAGHYRERAATLRKIADETSDDTTRKHLLAIVSQYEKMAMALGAVAPADPPIPSTPTSNGNGPPGTN